jgi:hypothetical protein
MDKNNLEKYDMFKNTLRIKFYFKRFCNRSNNIIKALKYNEILEMIEEFTCIDDKNHEIYNKVPCFIFTDGDNLRNINTDDNIQAFMEKISIEIKKINELNVFKGGNQNQMGNKSNNFEEEMMKRMESRGTELDGLIKPKDGFRPPPPNEKAQNFLKSENVGKQPNIPPMDASSVIKPMKVGRNNFQNNNQIKDNESLPSINDINPIGIDQKQVGGGFMPAAAFDNYNDINASTAITNAR